MSVPASAACVLVLRDGAVLAVSRKTTSRFGLPGGGIEPGEDERAAAARELWEETGLWTSPTGLVELLRAVEPSTQKVVVTFWARDPGGPVTPGSGEALCLWVGWPTLLEDAHASFPRYNAQVRDAWRRTNWVLACAL